MIIHLAGAVAATLITVLLVRDLRLRSLNRRLLERESLWRRILSAVGPGLTFDESAGNLLALISSLVDAPGYYLYMSGTESNALSLRVIRSEPETMRAGIYYSSLVEEYPAYDAPLSQDPRNQPGEVGFVGAGDLALLAIPIRRDGSTIAAIHVGPVRPHDIPAARLNLLKDLHPALTLAVTTIWENDIIRRKSDDLAGQLEAVSIAARGAYEPSGFVETMMSLGARLTGSDSWLLAVFDEYCPSRFKPVFRGISETTAREVISHLSSARATGLFPRQIEFIHDAGALRDSLGTLLRCGRSQGVIWAPLVHDDRVAGALILFVDARRPPDIHKIQALGALTTWLVGALDSLRTQEQVTRAYVESLKTLATFIDEQEIYSRGHSARVAKLAREIAGELDLAPRYLEAVELAGYLHDIGMCALKGELVFGAAKFTDVEYEEMKAHTTIGAALVGPVNDFAPLASLIKHHHERYDGGGYPDGLKGEMIPIGARIVAVADVFNAKITNRSYRRALSFGKAVEDMVKTEGTMLDPKCVKALLSSIRRKQNRAERRGKTLEPCWEMLQCPQYLRDACPAGPRDCHCWTVPGVRCDLHGSRCESCPVYTEYELRTGAAPGGVVNGR
ncbi:MAG: HD domain-containing phosphohydrolase [Ignavibacteriales bacterium]